MRPLFVAVLASGCTVIAPFDFTIEGVDGGPGRDGEIVSMCPTPCFGDVGGDFVAMQQQNGMLGWRYLEDQRGALGVAYDELAWGSHDGRDAFVGAGGSPPAIFACGDGSGACAGISGRLVALSDPESAGSDATFELTAPDHGVFRIVGSFRGADGVSSLSSHRWLFSRKSRYDALAQYDFFPSGDESAFDITAELLAGDPVRITLSGAEAIPIAMTAYVTAAGAFPGACELAVTFDGATPFVDLCRGATLENTTDGVADPDPGPTTEIASLDPTHGSAREFVVGRQIRSLGSAMDYRGDFTVQLWARVDEAAIFTDTAMYTDLTSEEPPGGVYISVGAGGTTYLGGFYRDDAACPSTGGICNPFAMTNRPTDGAWHFYRLVRTTADGTMRLCIDGREAARAMVPGAINLTSPYAPSLGRPLFGPGYFTGAIDEVRVFSRALPCAAP